MAVHCARDSGFEITHGFLNRVMEVLGVPHAGRCGIALGLQKFFFGNKKKFTNIQDPDLKSTCLSTSPTGEVLS